jgi:hypothetical protein
MIISILSSQAAAFRHRQRSTHYGTIHLLLDYPRGDFQPFLIYKLLDNYSFLGITGKREQEDGNLLWRVSLVIFFLFGFCTPMLLFLWISVH